MIVVVGAPVEGSCYCCYRGHCLLLLLLLLLLLTAARRRVRVEVGRVCGEGEGGRGGFDEF